MTDAHDDLIELCGDVERRIARRRVIPFLGAGASLAGRPRESDWQRDGYLPNGGELADQLAEEYAYPADETNRSLVRVAQYIDLKLGEQVLFEDLRATFTRPARPTQVHRFLAERAASCRAAGEPNPWPMIITTNYDDALERAFADVREPFDVVTYFAERDGPGGFRHRPPGGRQKPIERPNTYRAFDPADRTVIVKLHGGIDRRSQRADSFVITEDHYISYMANDVTNGLPACLLRSMLRCHLLFLGYKLEDWNLRVFLFRIWNRRDHDARSWAIQQRVNALDRRFWQSHDVEVYRRDLDDWVKAMRACRA